MRWSNFQKLNFESVAGGTNNRTLVVKTQIIVIKLNETHFLKIAQFADITTSWTLTALRFGLLQL